MKDNKDFRVNYSIIVDYEENLIVGEWVSIADVQEKIKEAESKCSNLNSIRVEAIIDVTSNFYRL